MSTLEVGYFTRTVVAALLSDSYPRLLHLLFSAIGICITRRIKANCHIMLELLLSTIFRNSSEPLLHAPCLWLI
jgi:hypothetical protein